MTNAIMKTIRAELKLLVMKYSAMDAAAAETIQKKNPLHSEIAALPIEWMAAARNSIMKSLVISAG